MGAKNIGQPLDLVRNELRNAVIQNLAAAPGTRIAGQLWFDTVGNALMLRRNADDQTLGSGGGGISNAYATITDGTTPANSSGGDTFKIRTANGHLTIVTQNNDATHGDNALFTVNAKTARTTNEIILVATEAGNGKISATFLTGILALSDLTDGTTTGTGSLVRQSYVDNLSQGVDWKASVRVATTANITLSGTQTIDGVAVAAGNRVLVKNQSGASQNGIYVVAAGAWSRSTDADASAEIGPGTAVFVSEGTLNADTGWILTTDTDPIVLETTNLTFNQFLGVGVVTGTNHQDMFGTGVFHSMNGNVLQFKGIVAENTSIEVSSHPSGFDVQIKVRPDQITVDSFAAGTGLTVAKGGTGATTAAAARTNLAVPKVPYTALIGDGSTTSFSITQATHGGAASRANLVQTLDESTGEYRMDSIIVASNGTVTIGINPAPASNAVRVIICG